MVTTGMSNGHAYIFDYLTDGDMDLQELDGKTAGDDYLVGAIPNWRSSGPLDFEKELFYGGGGYGMRYDASERVCMVNLKCTKAQHEDVWQYYYKHKDNKTSKDYFSWRWASTSYYPFFNKSGTKREYCEGFLTNVIDTWFDSENNLFEMLLQYEEVLSG